MSRLSKDDAENIDTWQSTTFSTTKPANNTKPLREQQEEIISTDTSIMCQAKTKTQSINTSINTSTTNLIQNTCVRSKCSTKILTSSTKDIDYAQSDKITSVMNNTAETNNDSYNYESVHYLSDIQEENSSALNLDNLAQVVVTTASQQMDTKGSSGTVDTNTSTAQTLLLALPQSLNFTQFSNQTLNLDYNSQQLLHSLLQLSTPPDTSSPLPTLATSTTRINESAIDDSQELVIDVSSAVEQKNYNASSNGSNTLSQQPEPGQFPKSSVQSTKLSVTMEEKQNTELVQQEQSPTQNRNNQGEQQNQLPTAAINVDMINGQPVYTIQLNGISIPIAAITIPTADGPRHLQSAITSLPQSTMEKVSDHQSKTNSSHSVSENLQQSYECSSTVTESKPKHTCEICGKSYVRAWSYFGHLREHLQSSDNKCTICGKQFESSSSLKCHMITHQSTEAKEYACTICDRSYCNANSLRTHQQSHNKEKNFKCQVEGCEKSFPSSSSLKTHQRVHQEEKPFKCTAPGCGKAFKTPSELSRHAFRHTGEKPYKCNQCDKAFVRNDDLRRHSFIHTGQKRFKCDQCDFSCIQSFDLVKHKYIHGGEKPYKCPSCPKEFTRPARLREHQRLHTGERPFQCEECGKSFTQMTSLKSHKLTHQVLPKTSETLSQLMGEENSKFMCPLCNKEFVSEKTLKRHAIVHSGEKPFECKVCNRKFARANDLKVHLPIHDAEKPFKCEQCNRTFTRFSSLKEHIRLHTGEFPFKCEYCEKVFNHRSHLNVHLRSHTGERPHKCHLCIKEFSRKISLRQHLRTHGVNEVSATMTSSSSSATARKIDVLNEDDVDVDVDSNFSDSSFIEGPTTIQLDPSNIHLWKTLQNVMKPLKRKRTDSEEDTEEQTGLLQKRLLTETQLTGYTSSEQMLSSISTTTDVGQLQGSEVTIGNTPNVDTVINTESPTVIFHQLPSDQLTQGHYLNSDGTTVVAFSLAEGTEGEVDSLVEIHGLESIQGLDAQSLIEQQQHPLNQHLQEEDMNNM